MVPREADDSWRSVLVTDHAATIKLEQLGVEFDLAELYAGMAAAS